MFFCIKNILNSLKNPFRFKTRGNVRKITEVNKSTDEKIKNFQNGLDFMLCEFFYRYSK